MCLNKVIWKMFPAPQINLIEIFDCNIKQGDKFVAAMLHIVSFNSYLDYPLGQLGINENFLHKYQGARQIVLANARGRTLRTCNIRSNGMSESS